MPVNTEPITRSPQYQTDYKTAFVGGKTKSILIFCFFIVFGTLILLPPLFIAAFLALVIHLLFATPEAHRQSKERFRALEAFVKMNGYSFAQPDKRTSFTLFKNIDSISPHITGQIQGYSFAYGHVHLERESDRSISCVALSIHLPIHFPRLYIDLKKNNITGFEASIHTGLADVTKYFEGDFHKYFTVKAEDDQETNILEILSPEVMAALIDHNKFDIYLDKKTLTLYQYNATEIEYFAFVPTLFPIAELLLKEINRLRLERHTTPPSSIMQ